MHRAGAGGVPRMRVAVIGAGGALGMQTVPRLLEHGHEVRLLATSASRLERLAPYCSDDRVKGFVGSILEPATLAPVLEGCDAVMHLATAIPPHGASPADAAPIWAMNSRIRTEGTGNLIAAAASAGVVRYLQQSIAHLAVSEDGAWVDESTPVHTTPANASTVEMEARVRGSTLDWRIVRGGAFYGPGSGREAFWLGAARSGTLQMPGDGSAYISLAHTADVAAACVAALEISTGRFIINAVDDEPVRYVELFGHIARLAGGPAPRPGGPAGLPSYRARNLRARELLGWRPFFASYRSGWAVAAVPAK